MVLHQLQNPLFVLDGLYCEEERFEEDLGGLSFGDKCVEFDDAPKLFLTPSKHDLFWEDAELVSLLSKEQEIRLGRIDLGSDGHRQMARREAVDWILKVTVHHRFVAMTAVLAVNYLDRFLSSLCFQRDKPWMGQLAAVACLSLAAKVEETQVPLLLDLQVENSKYVFEAKTIQRMELLVLSTLQWKMNPVTPLAFIDHLIRRLGSKINLYWEFLRNCERLLLSVITDSRFFSFLPSVVATATMLFVIQEIEPCNVLEYQSQLMSSLNVSKESVDECYKLLLELLNSLGHTQCLSRKRKYQPVPDSPNGVTEAYFSSDCSNDSWAVAGSVSSLPEPLSKRSRAQNQQMMRFVPLNHVSVGVLTSPP